MILSDLLHLLVRDDSGRVLGVASDARFTVTDDDSGRPAQVRLVGLIVSRRHAGSFAGYERTGVDSPWPIARFLRWRHRGSFLVHWEDIAEVSRDSVRLRTGFVRHPSALVSNDDGEYATKGTTP